MTDPKEFESLDELFRKTFDNLPDTPAKSGWDTPSERVWQHVQTQIKPPKSGWSAQTLTLIAAFAVTIAVGLYLFFNRPDTVSPATPAATPPSVAETTEQPTVAVREQAATLPSADSETAVLSAKNLKKKPAETNRPATTGAIPRNETEAAKEATADSLEEKAAKPSGKKSPSANSTERRKAELAKHAEEAWKTPLNPLPKRWFGKSEQ
jgi:hypothetical protein